MKHQLNTTQFQKPILEMAFLLLSLQSLCKRPCMFRTVLTRLRPTLFLRQPVPIPISKHVLFRWDSVALNDRGVLTGKEEYEKKATVILIPGTVLLRPTSRTAILCFRYHLIPIKVGQFRENPCIT